MEVVPALPVRDNRLVLGRPDATQPAPTPYLDGGDDVLGLARHLFARFGNVAVVDLGAGRTDDPHHNLFQKLTKHNVALWVDAAPASLEDVMDLFVSGAARVTIRTGEIDRDELEDILDIAEGEVWLGYPFHDPSELASQLRHVDPARYLEHGAAGAVLIDMAAAGTRRGFDARAIERVPAGVPVAVTGGIGRAAELEALDKAGADVALVSTALFDDVNAFKAAAEALSGGNEPPAAPSGPNVEFTTRSRGFLPGVLPSRPQIPRMRDDEETR